MRYYSVDILSPSKIVAKNVQAESLLIPTEKGQINVLENHTHLVTKLGTGMLSVFGGPDYGDRHFSITTGVCKILDNKIIVLTNVSEESTDVDAERAKLALKNGEDKLKNTEGLSLEDIEKYRRKVERAKLRIQLAGYTKNHTI
ncbi:MAG: ATP synthase F1 subunit epsilon [Bacteriovoracaceae bacterium]|nr:ATP synthase F1 subunit epsilon [Bacteriovoracaceae bacterium]